MSEQDTSASSTTQKLKRRGTSQPLTLTAPSRVRHTFYYKSLQIDYKKKRIHSPSPPTDGNVGYPPQLVTFIPRAWSWDRLSSSILGPVRLNPEPAGGIIGAPERKRSLRQEVREACSWGLRHSIGEKTPGCGEGRVLLWHQQQWSLLAKIILNWGRRAALYINPF